MLKLTKKAMSLAAQIKLGQEPMPEGLNIPATYMNLHQAGRALADIEKRIIRCENNGHVATLYSFDKVTEVRPVGRVGAFVRFAVSRCIPTPDGKLGKAEHPRMRSLRNRAIEHQENPDLAISKHVVAAAILRGRDIHFVGGDNAANAQIILDGYHAEKNYIKSTYPTKEVELS